MSDWNYGFWAGDAAVTSRTARPNWPVGPGPGSGGDAQPGEDDGGGC